MEPAAVPTTRRQLTTLAAKTAAWRSPRSSVRSLSTVNVGPLASHRRRRKRRSAVAHSGSPGGGRYRRSPLHRIGEPVAQAGTGLLARHDRGCSMSFYGSTLSREMSRREKIRDRGGDGCLSQLACAASRRVRTNGKSEAGGELSLKLLRRARRNEACRLRLHQFSPCHQQ